MEEVPPKVLKRADSLAKSAGSGAVVSFVGILIPFLAFLGMAIGFGYMAESRGLLNKYPALDQARQERLEWAIGRFKFMGIVGACVSGFWLLIIGLAVLAAQF